MSTTGDLDALEPDGRERSEVARLIRQIQALTLEVRELREHHEGTPALDSKERTLEQLRWRLAAVARRTATDDPDAAA